MEKEETYGEILQKLDYALEEINSEFGQEDPIRVKWPSYDLDDFHFEFAECAGLAYYKGNIFFLVEDDDFWAGPRYEDFRIQNSAAIASCWFPALKRAYNRMFKWINKYHPEDFKK